MKNILSAGLIGTGMVLVLGFAAVAQQYERQPNTLQNRQNTTEQYQNRLSSTDRLFMNKAAQGNLAEISLSQLALQRASSDQVKQYAQQMIDQHTQASNQLTQIAAQKGVTLPRQVDAQHQQIERQLQRLSGARFDQAYMRAMVNDHAQTVALFQRQTQQGRDRDVVSFASELLPAIQQHYTMANSMIRNLARR
ncbi:DUF4142 domain-containing protein [Phormidium sp. LEGE 05292]|uniref:DUF4142 domain-containing protein n=1 Tax=[Phormidium] sp. LEGE 05292 TaxID=767427 RepID=UPI00187FC72F|nr:DUF4142 domain-containing protein [Phormidium sp. LEGE 05292]MBE9226587.1 DUF4142 domain-containing protein [Phormidium sp. LEGE 05292]